jgi:hypothetical protein
MKLPVFTVASTVAPADNIRELGRRMFPREDQEIVERGSRIELRSKLGNVEIDVGSGGVWASDDTKLWRFDPPSARKRNLTAGPDAEKLSAALLKDHRILPDVAAPFRLKSARVTGAVTAYSATKDDQRRIIQEDTTVLTSIEVDVQDYGLKQALPVVGGGGRFGVVLGEGGAPLAARGVWRPAVGKPTVHEVIDQAKADEAYKALMAGVPGVKWTSKLAYYSAPSFTEQSQLYPVYVYSGVADYDGTTVPLRRVMIPATEVGPIPQKAPREAPRKQSTEPRIRPLPADLEVAPGRLLPPGIVVNRRLMQDRGLKFKDWFIDGPTGSPLALNPNLTAIQIKDLIAYLGYYSAGTSWIGLSGGLAGSKNNAKGFVDGLAAGGWHIRFNWGDAAAWESDWRQNDDQWVDAVDFVFYTGHANSDGWVLSAPDDTFLHFTETAGARDLWGANNLEWAVVAACGPLQDEVVGSGGNVLNRWRDAFDGLHILMGYAQVTFDNEEEGKRLVQYAKAGSTIIQSWFRTGQEIQGPFTDESNPNDDIWVGAYYIGNSTGSTGNDHLWGVGSVGPDIAAPTWRACSWVPC